ncbi:MAG: putative aminopeptidase FrvX [Candidatus Latescibacterota bacterium]|jgi:putative aminopeptidase FrvX
MSNVAVDREYLMDFLVALLEIPSPTGDTEAAIDFCNQSLKGWPLEMRKTEKGVLTATLQGHAQDRPRAMTAHVDTLGAMVKEVKANGRLKLTHLGGLNWASVECESVTVRTFAGDDIPGSIMPVKASSHVHGAEASEIKREANSLEVRIDAAVNNADEAKSLGIQVGDFVYIHPRIERHNGFIRSRFLDDKACVACMVAAIKALADARVLPAQRTTFHFSTYEEVGHGGASGFPQDIVELLTLDMAAVGEGQTSEESKLTICTKDTGGPYHLGFKRRLVALAEAEGIDYRLDIYPYYGSDGEAFWRSGADVAVGLVGPGIDGSHSYERTHENALVDTTRLLIAYLLSK